jgi:SPP1 gp7 family putative phage head morphogenesis protein
VPATTGASEYLLDQSIRHGIAVERFRAGEVRRILAFLNDDVIPDLLERLEGRMNRIASRGFDPQPFRTKKLRDMLSDLDEIVRRGRTELGKRLIRDMAGFASSESTWQIGRLREALELTGARPMDIGVPDAQTLRSIVTSRPFQGRFLRDELTEWGARTRSAVRQQIQIGMAAGESVSDIVRRVRGTSARRFEDGAVHISRRDAERIVRTAVTHVSTHARQAAMEANPGLVDRVQWISILDSRTSEICASLHGRTFPLRSGPRPPAHPGGCRSHISPVLVGDGPSDVGTFEAWWSWQSVDTQDEIFGPGKARLLRAGRITVKQLIDQRLRPLTLAQLVDLSSPS